jgi:hypothetical protein
MKALWLMLLVLIGTLAEAGSLYANETPIQTLLDQGFSHGALPKTTNGLVFGTSKKTGTFGIGTGEDTDIFKMDERVNAALASRRVGYVETDDMRHLQMLYTYLSTQVSAFGGTLYGTLVNGLRENDDPNGRKAPGGDDFNFDPVLGIGYAHVIPLPFEASLMPEVHVLYRYANLDEIRAGIGVGIRMNDDLSGHLGFDSLIQPGSPHARAFFSFKYRW